jgi:hypothetical protein
LDSGQPTGLKVATVASAGNNVVVTILGGTNSQGVGSTDINTPNLSVGSVTVLQAPLPKTFTLNMGSKQLTLNKGYKLQDINIITVASGSAVTINDPTAGLASVDVTCNAAATTPCVEVAGSGSHTLKDVTVDVKDSNANNIGILINANANLSIVGGIVKLTAEPTPSNQKAITLIQSNGVLTATGLTVDMTGGTTAHTQNSKGIILNKAGSLVTGSTIRVNNGPGSGTNANAIGIDVQHATGTSTVKNNIFIGHSSSPANTIAIRNATNRLSPDPSTNNAFSGNFASGGPVQ